MTRDDDAVAAFVRRSTASQGLPERLADPDTLIAVVTALRGSEPVAEAS